MKLWIVQEVAYVYNDEYYSRPNCGEGTGKPTKAFKTKKNADAECAELNAAARKENRYPGYEEGPDTKTYYEVVSVEVADEDAISYTDARDRVKAARAEAKKAARAAFEAGAKEVFGSNPELESFAWEQYTDYWNDGEPCKFGVRSDEPDINGKSGCDLDDGREYNYAKRTSSQVREPSIEYKLQQPVVKFLGQFDSDDMEAIFGDHVRITVTRGRGSKVKVETEEYTSHS